MISLKEFSRHESLYSSAIKQDWIMSLDPRFYRYEINLRNFLCKETYSTCRLRVVNGVKREFILTNVFEDKIAVLITYLDLYLGHRNLLKPYLFELDSLLDNKIIVYNCTNCNVFVVLDGFHRMVNWMFNAMDRMIECYQVSSKDWSLCKVDMKNFCKCNF